MREETVKKILLALGSLVTALFCLAPFGYMILISLLPEPNPAQGSTSLVFTLSHYQNILTDEVLHFLDYLRNSLIVGFLSAFIGIWTACLAAYALTRIRLRGKSILLFVTLTASMFPPISLVGWLFKMMSTLGWINTYPALILPYTAWLLPLALWILVSYFAQIPKDLDQAAFVDGASHWQTLQKILLPVAIPGILSAGLLAFLFAFNEFLFALMLTTDHQARTISVGIALFQGLYGQTPWGDLMAASCLVTVPVVILTVLFQKQMIQGLTQGSVKG